MNNSPLISLFKLTEIKKPFGCHKETKLSSHIQKRGENGSELQTYTNNSNQVIHRKATFHHLFKFSLEKTGEIRNSLTSSMISINSQRQKIVK